jgi:nucleoside-triphosphatase
MEHVFLTGPVHCGKSTLIDSVLSQLGRVNLGGFRTICVPSALPKALAEVYIVPAAAARPVLDRDNLIGIRWGDHLATAFAQAFETGGLALLRNSGGAQLLLMDELGMMEGNAPRFLAAVASALDGDIPVLGVIKQQSHPFLNSVRDHPRVRLLEVDIKNRDQLVPVVADLIKNQL